MRASNLIPIAALALASCDGLGGEPTVPAALPLGSAAPQIDMHGFSLEDTVRARPVLLKYLATW